MLLPINAHPYTSLLSLPAGRLWRRTVNLRSETRFLGLYPPDKTPEKDGGQGLTKETDRQGPTVGRSDDLVHSGQV